MHPPAHDAAVLDVLDPPDAAADPITRWPDGLAPRPGLAAHAPVLGLVAGLAAGLALTLALSTGPATAGGGGDRSVTSGGGAPLAQAGSRLTTASGLQLTLLQPGQGPRPRASDTVQVHYRGLLADGSEFDSSHRHRRPAEFALADVIPCWGEALQKLAVGSRAQIVCPPHLAYGHEGEPGLIPPNATLRFELELLAIVRPGHAEPTAAAAR